MAVGEHPWQDLYPIAGCRVGVASAGIKYANRNDLAVVSLCEGSSVAGVFTQSAFAAAPVHICKKHLRESRARAFVINSGNANACTGAEGHAAALATCEKAAALLSIQCEQVLPFSTGVIGEVLPAEKVLAALPQAISALSEHGWAEFAQAIMTTDTRPKGATQKVSVNGCEFHVSGVAKGAGMINPKMATMLGFIATDAPVANDLLQSLAKKAADQSFNRVTIDGDTSTNDACMLAATGQSSMAKIEAQDSEEYQALEKTVIEVYQSLAMQIVEDAEGATKFVTIDVQGGSTADESLTVAYAIAHSPLVKTALFASDPNWGRIVAAIGYANVDGLDASKVRVWLDDVLIVEDGGRAKSYREEDGQRIFNQERFTIHVDLGRGQAREKLWTSDLSHEYIRINAEYRS